MPTEPLSSTAWKVSCPLGAGQVEAWGYGLVVYVDQPGRSCVEDDDGFAALERTPDGTVTRFDGRVTDDAFDLARAVLAEFDDDPATPARLTDARSARAAELVAEYDRLEQAVTARVGELEGFLEDLQAARGHLEQIADDPMVSLPYLDALATHPALLKRSV
jgi:hypothetical protein